MAGSDLVLSSLDLLSGLESRVVERFYPLFFARHPEVCPLFGEHGISEREEMIRETFACVLAHLEGESWLDDNLEAMGKSHDEYGVEGPMYQWFVDSMLDTLEEVLAPERLDDQSGTPGQSGAPGQSGYPGQSWTSEHRKAWSEVLGRLADTMRRAGAASETGASAISA
jgi:hemoglobin-like flavoprotein